MNTIYDLTLEALRDYGTESLVGYEWALEQACSAFPPPYGMAWYGERYRSVAVDPGWLANSLVSNAVKEGEGSRKLWDLSGRTRGDIAEHVRLHAIDEARHSRLYLVMLDVAFPEAVGEELRSQLKTIPPPFSLNDHPPVLSQSPIGEVLDELIQMNIGEIRTRIHQLLLRPIISLHCQEGNRSRLIRILDSLLQDETKHIQYTARLINRASSEGHQDFVVEVMQKRLSDFNDITLEEVGGHVFEGA